MAAQSSKRVVVKLGTSVLTAGTDRLHRPRMVELVRQLAGLKQRGLEPVLVTSGAVLAGWEQLGFPKRKRTVAEKQLLAAIGQGRLMHLYAQLADIYGLTVAQTLLTRDDLRHRQRYLNARHTLLGCLERGVLPIVNENDVVAVDEIKVGDNDTLSARVAALIEADLLIILSDIKGLYTADPRQDPTASLIQEVPEVTEAVWALAGEAGSHRGTGGMRTKIQAAELATHGGTEVIIASGDEPDVILRLVGGEAVGTRFRARETPLEARKRWILAETARQSRVVVDAGAADALRARGKSLLPAGVTQVEGSFEEGHTIRIYDPEGKEVARGLSQYCAADLLLLAGKRSEQIEAVLGFSNGPEVVHRDDMVVLDPS